jgi:hypothetical protein
LPDKLSTGGKQMKRALRNIWLIGSLALVFVLAPITFDLTTTLLAPQSAFAKGGNGNSSSANADTSADTEATGHGHGKGRGLGHATHADETETASGHTKGSTSSKLGRLNAAHASPTARSNAAPHSAVGRIATYEEAVNETLAAEQAHKEDPTNQSLLEYQQAYLDQEEALAAAANKDIDEDVAQAVNGLLGIDTPEEPPEETPEETTEETAEET